MEGVLSLPILWADPGGSPLPGRADLSAHLLQLDAGAREERRTRDIPLAEIRAVRIARRPHERLRGRPALHVELRDGSVVALAALGGLGALHDLGERLWTLTGTTPEPEPEAA